MFRAYQNETLKRLVNEATNGKGYESIASRYYLLKYQLRDLIQFSEVNKSNADKEQRQDRSCVEITFKKELAELINFEILIVELQSDYGNLCDRNGTVGDFTITPGGSGDVVVKYDGSAHRGSLNYMRCAIPYYIETEHERLMKKSPHVLPLFYAEIEMKKIRTLKTYEKFEEYKETMYNLMDVLDVLHGKAETAEYCLYPKFMGCCNKDDANEAFEKLLKQLHNQSKEMLVSKNGAIIGGLMVAFGALMVAAGVALGLTLGWTGVGLFAGAGLMAGGAALASGGVVAIKEREHFGKVSRLMNNHYNLFNRLYNDEVDKPAQPKRKPQ